MNKGCFIVVALLIMGLLISGCGPNSGTAGDDGYHSAMLDLACCEFMRGFNNLTQVQLDNYFNQYKGETVTWAGQVSQVASNYVVTFEPRGGGLAGSPGCYGSVYVAMDSSQKGVLSNLDKGDVVLYQGVVESFHKDSPPYTSVEIELKSGRVISRQPLQLTWEMELETSGWRRDGRSMLITPDCLYVAGADSGTVTAADIQTGAKRWEKTYSTVSSTFGRYQFVGYDEQHFFFYYFDGQHWLVAADRTTGQQASSEKFQSSFTQEVPSLKAQQLAGKKGSDFVATDKLGWETTVGDTIFGGGNADLAAYRARDRQFLWGMAWPTSTEFRGSTSDLLLIFSSDRVQAFSYEW